VGAGSGMGQVNGGFRAATPNSRYASDPYEQVVEKQRRTSVGNAQPKSVRGTLQRARFTPEAEANFLHWGNIEVNIVTPSSPNSRTKTTSK